MTLSLERDELYREGSELDKQGGFWSYAHDDDNAEQGRIVMLARDIVAQYGLVTGESIELFLDNGSLLWGDDWRKKIDEALSSIVFFVPIITPRYFMSAECRLELQSFVRRAEALGVRELILPIVYVNVLALRDEQPTDDAVALVKTFQWEDCSALRLEDRSSGAYRSAVARVAQRLADADRKVLLASTVPAPMEAEESSPQEGPGSLDLLAAAEVALPRWSHTMTAVREEIDVVAAVVTAAAEQMKREDTARRGFAGRLGVVRRLAGQLSPHAERIVELANDFTTDLYDVDGGMQAMIGQAPTQAEQGKVSTSEMCSFFSTVLGLCQASRDGLTGLRRMVEAVEQSESVSRDLRPPLQTLRKGLTVMVEGQSVTDEWERLIQASPVECQG